VTPDEAMTPHQPPGDPVPPRKPSTTPPEPEPDEDDDTIPEQTTGQADPTGGSDEAATETELMKASEAYPFGPGFFLTQLRAFVGEQAPQPSDGLPWVEIHIASGEVFDLCHILGVTPTWVAMVVREPEPTKSRPRTRTEMVPFATIIRVTLRTARPESPQFGFDKARVPQVWPGQQVLPISPERALEAAARQRQPKVPTGD
jgi:hypothetical protein